MSDDEIVTFVAAHLGECARIRHVLLEEMRIHRQIDTATSMLRSGMPRSEAQVALRERFGISRRTAYRILDAALDQKGKT
jgi:DNA gyrase/topoisomerase IV subunit A